MYSHTIDDLSHTGGLTKSNDPKRLPHLAEDSLLVSLSSVRAPVYRKRAEAESLARAWHGAAQSNPSVCVCARVRARVRVCVCDSRAVELLADMAADPTADWLSCLPSTWSYGVTRDGRVFFLK